MRPRAATSIVNVHMGVRHNGGGLGHTMNKATIRFFTQPLKRFLDRVSLAHFVIVVIRLAVTVEFSQSFQAKLSG